ncbi:right-handed parallel beta-helix repeat-containing protein [Arthrobacter sp. MSA 4-2]|uniref:glycosyl hydrolase family 28-related protein n=1 Tax=Arthrobacter sp. MSA 4-2 TaxID=2794349 RepID=UPI0018E6FA27|nr:glycosyl hydrolase family 28-related protein [Arthrobacter sp. MSA 4-2]MBJ2119431.1 right-handed parallel beta-helix repeat-containing protein [Arthrobacter sp. MSA 4-2]
MSPHRLKAALLAVVVVGASATAFTFSASGDTGCAATGSRATSVFRVDSFTAGNSDAVQAAIDAATAQGGGIVQLSAGQFDIDRPLWLKDNVALRGSGPDTVLKASARFLDTKGPHGGHPLVTTEGAENVTIADLTADQSGEIFDGNVEGRLNEYLIDVRHTDNAVVDGVATRNPFTYSIAVVGSLNFCVRDSSTVADSSGRYDQLDGIHITDSHSGAVIGNRVDQGQGEDGDDGLVAQTIGAEVYDVVYRGNDVRGGSHGAGMQLAVSGHEIHDITIEGNRFWGSPSGIRTGYYNGATQAVHDIAMLGNTFFDNEGTSINFKGDLENIRVEGSTICRSGEIKVADGAGNSVESSRTHC